MMATVGTLIMPCVIQSLLLTDSLPVFAHWLVFLFNFFKPIITYIIYV